LSIEPREVPTRYGTTIDRGVSPPNDYIRAFQGAQDYLTRPHEGAASALNPISNLLQDRALRKNVRQADRQHRAQQAADEQGYVSRVEEARRRLSSAQQERVLAHEQMGFTPTELSRMRGSEDPGLPPLTRSQEAYRQALEDYRRFSEGTMLDSGLLSESARLHREVDPVAQVRAAHGDEVAQQYLAKSNELDHLQSELDFARNEHPEGAPEVRSIEGQISQAVSERDDLLRAVLARHTAEGNPAPTRVPLRPANQRHGLFFNRNSAYGPGGVKRRGQRHYTGSLFEQGNYEAPTHADVMRDIRAPVTAQTYHRLANYLLDPGNGIAVRADARADIPEDMVLVRPAQRTPPSVTQEAVRPGESIFKRLDFNASRVPPNEGYVLVPRVVAEEIQSRGKRVSEGKPGGKISQGLRNVLLYTRPSYAATNLTGNIQQNLLEDVGPLSYLRAGRNDLPVPPTIEEGGAVRTNFSAYGQSVRDAIQGQSPARAAATVLGRPVASYTQAMRSLAQQVEDFTRRAAYHKQAVPAARRLAHPDAGAFQRFQLSMRGVDDATRAVLDQMANGSDDAAVQLAARNALQAVDRTLGDWSSLASNDVVDIVVPFHRWAQFASRLLAVTLPVHYPGKALILYRLGSLGQEAQNQLGPLTPSLQGVIPVGNDPSDILALNTSYPNTFATLGESLAVDPRGGSSIGGLNPKGAATYLSPLARLTQALVTGIDPTSGFVYTNPRGEGVITSDRDHPADPNATTDFLRLVAGQALSMVPPLRLAFQPANPADTSIPLPFLTQSRYQPPVPAWAASRQAPQTQLPLDWEQRLFNFVSPFRVRRVNLAELAQQGIDQTSSRLAATQRKETR
jgi:hypothetical protein